MAWKMSHDYVAIVISVDAALLLLGTIQYSAAFRRTIANWMTVLREYRDDVNRLFEEMRQGTDPSPSDVLATYPTNKVTIFRSMTPKRLVAGLLATGLYSGWCVLMVTLMSSLLEWAGTADADANPELAKRAFWTTSLSLFALLVEVYLLGAIEGFQKVWTLQKEARNTGTPEEWARMAALHRAASVAPQNPPESQGSTQ